MMVRWLLISTVVALAGGVAAKDERPEPAAMQVGVAMEANRKALRRAIEDLSRTFSERYTRGAAFLKRLDTVKGDAEFRTLRREALLANPLLDFSHLLLIQRTVKEDAKSEHVGLSQNWLSTCALKGAFNNQIAVLSPVRPGGKLTTVFKPESPAFVGEMNLHFDADRLLVSMPNSQTMFEPVPLRKTAKPPVIPDRVNLASPDATVYVSDVYAGPGLKGVPRGTIKQLRLFSFHYTYWGLDGHIPVGIDGPWDAHRILGTVPVLEDGSAAFKIPANTPIAVQPLDAGGQTVQVMRSWMVAMPGETLSCVGCHESVNSGPLPKANLAMRRPPAEITPWRGPARGFAFGREVQPVPDKYCVGCHNGEEADRPNLTGGLTLPPTGSDVKRQFDASYVALHPYVRRPGPESDIRIQNGQEPPADTGARARGRVRNGRCRRTAGPSRGDREAVLHGET
jgi:hypothetical protein